MFARVILVCQTTHEGLCMREKKKKKKKEKLPQEKRKGKKKRKRASDERDNRQKHDLISSHVITKYCLVLAGID